MPNYRLELAHLISVCNILKRHQHRMVRLTKEQLKIFIQENNIQLIVYEFRENYCIRGPISFSTLGKVLRFNQPCPAAWKFSSFLKGFPPKRAKESSPNTVHGAEWDASVSEAKKRRVEDPYLDCNSKEFEEAFRRLNTDFLTSTNLNSLKKVLKHSKEEDLEIGLGIHLISKLAGTVSTNRSKSRIKCPCGCQEQVQANDRMWIGSPQTWYGELDLIAGNPVESANVSNVIVAEELLRTDTEPTGTEPTETQDEEDLSDSPGERTNVEVKQKIVDMKQVISQNVVFAFTEYNRHPTKGAFIPSIVINRDCFSFVIYNPVMDLLLVSGDIEYSSDVLDELDENNFCRAFIFIWVILNHRIFFLHDVPFAEQLIFWKSSFHKNMEGFPNQLHCYNELKDYSIHINSGSIEKSRPRIGPESLLSMETLMNVRECEEKPHS